jgi:hypothetical protein
MDERLGLPMLAAEPASAGAVATLVVILVSAVMFTVGWRLAAQRRYQAHRLVQTVAVCLNAAVVLAWMVRSFIEYVLPRIPDRLDQAYAVTTFHAVVGAVGLVFGVFVALRGNELVPQALKFTNYKPYMQAAYWLYMAGTATGVLTYVVIYVMG